MIKAKDFLVRMQNEPLDVLLQRVDIESVEDVPTKIILRTLQLSHDRLVEELTVNEKYFSIKEKEA